MTGISSCSRQEREICTIHGDIFFVNSNTVLNFFQVKNVVSSSLTLCEVQWMCHLEIWKNVEDENNILGGKRQRPILHKRHVTWEFWHRIHFCKRKIYEFQWGPYLFSPRWQLINYALMIHGTYKMKTT